MSIIFVDTSFLIADTRENDENHHRAVELNKSSDEKRLISDLVLHEVLTYIKFHDDSQKAYEIGEKLFDLENFGILLPAYTDLKDALWIMKKYDKLSFCDSLIAAQMKNNHIKKLLSFDSGFDLIPWIERIY